MGLEEPLSDPSGHRRDVASDLEVLDGLLSTLTDVLDISEVFDRVSQLVKRVLPHDLMGVLEISETGEQVRIRMSAGADTPPQFEGNVPQGLFTTPWDVIIVDDISGHPIFSTGPAQKAGMNSALAVPIRFAGRLQAAVVFLFEAIQPVFAERSAHCAEYSRVRRARLVASSAGRSVAAAAGTRSSGVQTRFARPVVGLTGRHRATQRS